jgi:Sec-independent protein translocase protein TatA
MTILGIGPLELFFIVIIALIILGPRDMVKAGKSIGRLMRRTIFSPTWLSVQNKVRNLPYELMREAGLDEEDLKIDPKQFDLGLENQAKSLHNTTTQFSRDVEKAVDIPSEWTASPALSSNSNSSGESPSELTRGSEDNIETTGPDDDPVLDIPNETENIEIQEPEPEERQSTARVSQGKQEPDFSQGEDLVKN